MQLSIEDIKKIIPHRYPFLLIDRVEDIVPGKKCRAIKNITNNEWFFEGHFPKSPVMPGVLIVESMAQTACVLAFKTSERECADVVYFTSIENTKFKKPVLPGDVLKLDVSIEQRSGKLWRFKGEAYVENDIACISEFKAMVP